MSVPALRYLLSRGAAHDGGDAPGYPPSLSTALRRGLPLGPWAYVTAATRSFPWGVSNRRQHIVSKVMLLLLLLAVGCRCG